MSPEGLTLIGQLGLSTLEQSDWNVEAVGGLTLGADPVAYAIAYASAQSKQMIRAFTVRKEAKGHGTGQLIEGPFKSGDRVAIVEDVITTGASALRAASAVTAAGGLVAGVLAVVDREEGGTEALVAAGFSVKSLTRATEIIQHMPAA
jgi:orotate phosphoribosyltransferase